MATPRRTKSSVVKLAGCWDIWEDAEREYDIHWRFMTKHFGIDGLCMTPVTGAAERLKKSLDYTETKFNELSSLEAVIKANRKLTPVIVDENGTTTLAEFEHPKNALYLFGKVGVSPLDTFQDKYASVRVPSWAKQANASWGLLHPHQAASIVLYDRMTKLSSSSSMRNLA